MFPSMKQFVFQPQEQKQPVGFLSLSLWVVSHRVHLHRGQTYLQGCFRNSIGITRSVTRTLACTAQRSPVIEIVTLKRPDRGVINVLPMVGHGAILPPGGGSSSSAAACAETRQTSWPLTPLSCWFMETWGGEAALRVCRSGFCNFTQLHDLWRFFKPAVFHLFL